MEDYFSISSVNISFKGRLAGPPEFDKMENGTLRARLRVRIGNGGGKDHAAPCLAVSYLGPDAEYIREKSREGICFREGCAITVSHASAAVHTVYMGFPTYRQYADPDLDSVSADIAHTVCGNVPVKPLHGACEKNNLKNGNPAACQNVQNDGQEDLYTPPSISCYPGYNPGNSGLPWWDPSGYR